MRSNRPSHSAPLRTPPLAVSVLLLYAFGYWWSSPTPAPEVPAPEGPPAFDLSLAARRPDPRTTPRPRPGPGTTSRS
jgi:hypothetical protein